MYISHSTRAKFPVPGCLISSLLLSQCLANTTDNPSKAVLTREYHHRYDVSWQMRVMPYSLSTVGGDVNILKPCGTDTCSHVECAEEATKTSKGPRLCLIGGFKLYPDQPGKMGLVPPEAREGDYICEVSWMFSLPNLPNPEVSESSLLLSHCLTLRETMNFHTLRT